jgi:hypothetical protein
MNFFSKIFLIFLLSLVHILSAQSLITIRGTGTSSTSAHITVTSTAKLCPDSFVVETGASLTTWDPSAVCGASISGGGDISLPVELSSFVAVALYNKVILTWVTESELNNLGFIVMRGDFANGPFVELDSYNSNSDLLGAGNSSTRQEYTFTDENVKNYSTYWYVLIDVNFNGVKQSHGPELVYTKFDNFLRDFILYQNFPNPFNPVTRIPFNLPVESKVSLKIFNVLGEEIHELVNTSLVPGFHEIVWDGKNTNNRLVGSGTYIYQIFALSLDGKQRYTQSKKMLLVH